MTETNKLPIQKQDWPQNLLHCGIWNALCHRYFSENDLMIQSTFAELLSTNSFSNISSFVSESITASFLLSTLPEVRQQNLIFIVHNQMQFETIEPSHGTFTCFRIFTENTMIYSVIITGFQRSGVNKRYFWTFARMCLYRISCKWDKSELHNFYKSVITYDIRIMISLM